MLSRCRTGPVICFRQCVLHIFSILNTHVKYRLKKTCYRNGSAFKVISTLLYIYTHSVFLAKTKGNSKRYGIET